MKIKLKSYSMAGRKPTKYLAKKTEVNGITFDSKKEAARYLELCGKSNVLTWRWLPRGFQFGMCC